MRIVSRRRKAKWIIASGMAALIAPLPVLAQEGPPEGGDDGDIVVTGVRRSLERAADIKRDSVQVVDAIVADDIGKLPDPTTAAALQRVPGVQVSVNRNNELADVRVRGLPDTLATVNGREVFTTTERGFSLQDIPAEALSRVNVYKSQTADLIEGGLAGSLDLVLNRPFAFRKPTFVASARANYGVRDGEVGPQLGALATKRWDTGIGEIGILANGTFSSQSYARAGTVLTQRRSAATAPYNTPGILLPNVFQNFPHSGKVERHQFNLAGQWQVNPQLQIYAEGFYTYFRDRGSQQGFNFQPFTSSFGTTIVSITDVVPSDNCITSRVTGAGQHPSINVDAAGNRTLGANTIQTLCQPKSATFNNLAINQSNNARDNTQRNKQFAGGAVYENEGWKAAIDASYQTSRTTTKSIIVDLGQRLSSMSVTFDEDGLADFTTNASVLTDPTNMIIRNSFQQNYTLSEGELFQAKADVQRQFDGGFLKTVKVGGRYADRSASFRSVQSNNPVPAPAGTTGSPNFGVNEANIVYVSTLGLPSSFLGLSTPSPDINGGAAALVPATDFLLSERSLDLLRPIFNRPLGRPDYDPGRQFDAAESTLAGYVQADYGIDFAGGASLDGTIGVRVVQTDRSFDGFQATTAGGVTTYQPLHAETSNRNVLPAATARFRSGGFQSRLGYQKSIRRPDFASLNPALTLNTSFNPLVQSSASSGNPNLRDQKSDSFDATLEYYFRGGYIALAGYYRNITDRVITSSQAEIFNGLEYATARPRNVGEAKLQGIEASGQYFLDFLPGALSGLGVAGSFTYSDSEIGGDDVLAGYALQGVSKYNYTASLLYEKSGISGRLVYTYRSKYLDSDASGTNGLRQVDLAAPTSGPDLVQTPLVTYVRPSGRLDFNIGVDVTKQLRIDVGGTNILRNRTRSYYAINGLSSISASIHYDETTYTVGARFRF